MTSERMLPRGRLRLDVRDRAGRVVAERRATNLVLRGGAELVARRFAGVDEPPVNAVGVGFGLATVDAGATALTPPADPAIPAAALRSPITPDAFTIVTDRPGVVQVSLASVFHPAVELANVTEAGLFAGDRLYNQVVFEPVTLRVDQDVTFFWEIDFPFGI